MLSKLFLKNMQDGFLSINEAKYNSNISPRENIKVIGKEVKKFIRNFDDSNEKNQENPNG